LTRGGGEDSPSFGGRKKKKRRRRGYTPNFSFANQEEKKGRGEFRSLLRIGRKELHFNFWGAVINQGLPGKRE